MHLDTPVFLTVRGKVNAAGADAARLLHNQTAGSPQGIEAARSLGDLSHLVYLPVPGALSSAKEGELLFHDVWEDPKGLMQFFSSPDVQRGGAALFAQRDATVWMPAAGSFSFHLPNPARRTDRFIGMVRGTASSPEQAIAAFRAVHQKHLRAARRRGQISHQLFVRLPAPGQTGPAEVLGVDAWFDMAGMAEHYDAFDMAALGPAFSGRPDASTWRAAPGEWAEW